MTTQPERKGATTEPIRLAVGGMTCDHGDTTVAGALRRAGLDELDVDWRTGSAIGVASAEFSTRRAADELEPSAIDSPRRTNKSSKDRLNRETTTMTC
jgi:hypothetical protein